MPENPPADATRPTPAGGRPRDAGHGAGRSDASAGEARLSGESGAIDDRYDPGTDHLSVERRADGVVLVTLVNPARRNAMSQPMTAAWARLMGVLRHDRGARVLVVTGQGSAFCSGGDTGWIGADPGASVPDLRARMLPFYQNWLAVRTLEIPTIAAINGPAIGAGAALALACDLRLASTQARFSVPFTQLGMHPGMATTWLLPEVAGLAVARDLLLTGRTLSPDELVRLGIASRVLPAESFLHDVLRVASEVAATAPVAARLTKVALADGGHASYDAALHWEALAQPITMATSDLQEGLAAASERRPPRFSGS